MENCKHIKLDHYKTLETALKTLNNIQNNKTHRCMDCNSCLYLFFCIDCNFLGCSKNEHYRTHYKNTNHSFAYNTDKDCIYCFVCENYAKRQNTKKLNNFRHDRADIISDINQNSKQDNTKTENSPKTIAPDSQGETYGQPLGSNTTTVLLAKLSDKAYKVFPCVMIKGFANLGNTCYLNSLLSILIYSDEFKDYFLGNKHCIASCWEENCILCGFKEIYSDIYSKQQGVTFHNFLFRLTKKDPYFLGSKQHDVHELFIHIAELIHNSNKELKCVCLMHTTFFGINYVNYTCVSCNFAYQREEEYFNLSLQLSDSMNTSLQNFFDYEIINDLKCEKCNINTDFSRKCEIKVLPKLLCLHVKRFKCEDKRITKIADLIYNDNSLKLNDKCYYLYGFIVHEGDLNKGHYVSYIRIEDTFKCFDDEKIKDATVNDIQKNKSYIVFYRQI